VRARASGQPARPVATLLQASLKEPGAGVDLGTHNRVVAQLAEVISRCLQLDPDVRTSPAQALDLPFFKKDR